MQQEIYLDNSATTRQLREVTVLMADIAENLYGNPSSLHRKGLEAEKLLKEARETIAATLNAEAGEILFTSGGTESNNLAILGYLAANPRKGRHLITTADGHPSVLEVYKSLEKKGYEVDYIGVGKDGLVDPEELSSRINKDTALISITLVNSETGAVQQVEQLAAIRDAINPLTIIHADAVQAYGKIPLCPEKAGVGLLSLSAHKIHGPKGTGALYVSGRVKIKPTFFGGIQERLMRPGTENVPGIAGFGLASKVADEKLKENLDYMTRLKKFLTDELLTSGIRHQLISPLDSLPYIVNVSFENIRGEVLLHHLGDKGIFVSTGSACSSRKNTRSHVLTAMGIPDRQIEGAIRFSFSADNTPEEAGEAVRAIKDIIPNIEIKKKYGARDRR